MIEKKFARELAIIYRVEADAVFDPAADIRPCDRCHLWLIAMGFAVIYKSTGLVNFAQGEMT